MCLVLMMEAAIYIIIITKHCLKGLDMQTQKIALITGGAQGIDKGIATYFLEPPKDIAELALYLVSDQASFITGANFVIDGGMTRKMIYV